MKDIPILMSAPMVLAILADRKTQTRRIMNPQLSFDPSFDDGGRTAAGKPPAQEALEQVLAACRYGKPGDRLWVRETHSVIEGRIAYRADTDADGKIPYHYCLPADAWRPWKPSIFMRREHSRITLEIESVRVERLQDISEEDCLAEGISKEMLTSLLTATAARCKEEPEHWVHGADEGLSYCRPCCVKKVRALLKENPKGDYCLDGGWGIEGDSTPFCETCGKRLSNSLTDYGCQQELDHFEQYGCVLKSPDDCLSLLKAAEGVIWDIDPKRRDDDRYEKTQRLLHRVAYRVLWESINGPGSWESNPWVWVVEFKRLAATA